MHNDFLLLMFTALGYLGFMDRALAYIDPGAGSMLIQVLIGGIAAGAVLFKLYWYKFKSFFARNRSQSSDDDVKKQPDQ